VGVLGGVAEQGRDAILEVVGEEVLEHLRLLVDPVPRHPERLGQVSLEQPVMADDLEGDLAACVGQRRTLIRHVPHEPQVVQPLEHVGRRRRGHRQAACEVLGRHEGARRVALVGAGSLGFGRVDVLEVILGRGRGPAKVR
jgi:hypothetical protein